jgi:hypothetical protein
MVTAVADRGRNAVLALFHRRIRQADDDDLRIPPAPFTSISTS